MSVPSPKALRKLSSNAPNRYHESNTASVTRSRLKVFLIDRLFRMKHEATLPRTPTMAKIDCTVKFDVYLSHRNGQSNFRGEVRPGYEVHF